MRDPGSLAGLLATLLSVPEDKRDFATPSFEPWLGDAGPESSRWAPHGEAGLRLVDTRDRAGRGAVRSLESIAGFHTALVLTGTGIPGSALRRVLRRVRRSGTRRVAPSEVEPLVRSTYRTMHVQAMAFRDGLEVPTSFRVDASDNTGTAFLITQQAPFTGPLWSFIGKSLDAPDYCLAELHLRARGAAVAMVGTTAGRRAVRIVPDEGLQAVVHRNHETLSDLRRAMRNDSEFLRLTPTPLFAEHHESNLVLAESSLPGTLAWRVATDGMAAIIYENTRQFLRRLEEAAPPPVELTQRRIDELFGEDQRRLREARFVDEDVRSMIADEFRRARAGLASASLRLHVSHGDFGYGNILVEPTTGALQGVIDWDTARLVDLPGLDRVNLEIQIWPAEFSKSVEEVWRQRRAHEALPDEADAARALYGVAVCRYILRSFSYPAVYHERAGEFRRALRWLTGQP